jgi:hypothetical protein
MRIRGWQAPVVAGLALLITAPAVRGQTTAPPEAVGPEPPELVLAGRDVRMTRAGYGHFKLGCRETSTPGEACLGTLTLRLAQPVTVAVGRHHRRVPSLAGRAGFQIPVGVAETLTIKLPALVQRAVRQLGSIQLQLVGGYADHAGRSVTVKRYVTLYFPTAPPSV